MSTFEVLAHEQAEEQQTENRSIVAARVRAQEAFGPFLAGGDLQERLAWIDPDLESLAEAVADEYGYANMEHIKSAARSFLACTCEGDDCKDCDCKECHKESAVKVACDKEDCDDPDCKHHGEKEDKKDGWEKPWEKKEAAGPEDISGDSFQHERADLPSNSVDSLGDTGAVPTDKSKSGDNTGWNLKPIDVGSKQHPHTVQDVTEGTDYKGKDFDGANSNTTTQVDVETTMQPEHLKGPRTDTWSGTEGQKDPVTNQALSKYQAVTVG